MSKPNGKELIRFALCASAALGVLVASWTVFRVNLYDYRIIQNRIVRINRLTSDVCFRWVQVSGRTCPITAGPVASGKSGTDIFDEEVTRQDDFYTLLNEARALNDKPPILSSPKSAPKTGMVIFNEAAGINTDKTHK